jgi:hypothetical protein
VKNTCHIVYLVLSLYLLACSKGPQMAPKEIKNSFSAIKNNQGLTIKDEYLVGIKGDSFDKEFLLQLESIMQSQTPRFTGMKSRIIVFRKKRDKVYMLSSTKDYQQTTDLPVTHLLAEFNIVKSENGFFYIDFSEGMKKVFTLTDWNFKG